MLQDVTDKKNTTNAMRKSQPSPSTIDTIIKTRVAIIPIAREIPLIVPKKDSATPFLISISDSLLGTIFVIFLISSYSSSVTSIGIIVSL